MIHYFGVGLLLGLSAGLAPGPLLTLVVSETLRHDIKAGIKVALAPLISDLPIVAVTVWLLAGLSGFDGIMGGISLLGGSVVFMMGIGGIRTKPPSMDIAQTQSNSLFKGVLVNVLSPHPYLFWLGVGAPTMTRAYELNIFLAVSFVSSFYIALVGSKVVLALLVGRSRAVLSGRGYLYTMRVLGVLLCFLALILFKDGLEFFGWMVF